MILDLINRIRRIAVLTKYTFEIRKLLIEGILKAKTDGLLYSGYNKTKIPNGKSFNYFIFILFY